MASPLRRRLRLAAALAIVLVGLIGGWLWVRDSSLVAVSDVEIVGVQGRQAKEIEAALTSAARDMTTLHVRSDALLAAAERYPVVRSLRTETDIPHRLRIVVNAHEPVVALEAGGQRTAVSTDGTILRGASTQGLPRLKLRSIEGGDRIGDEQTRRAVRLLAAAPPRLRDRVQRVFRSRRGLTTTMRAGPKLYFGGGDRFTAKWAAAAQVLGDGGAQGASYIDVRLPGRPTAGGLPPLPPEPKPGSPAEVVPEAAPEPVPETGVPTG